MIGECPVSCYALLFHILPKSSDIRRISSRFPSGAALFSVQFSVQAGGIEANRCVDDGIVITFVAKSMQWDVEMFKILDYNRIQ